MPVGPVGPSAPPYQPTADLLDDPQLGPTVHAGMQAIATQGYQEQKAKSEEASKKLTEKKEDDDDD